MMRFIVADITKSWTKDTPVSDLLNQKFEQVINTNFERGYKLIDWKINTFVFKKDNEDVYTETIIAIFEKI